MKNPIIASSPRVRPFEKHPHSRYSDEYPQELYKIGANCKADIAQPQNKALILQDKLPREVELLVKYGPRSAEFRCALLKS